MDRMVQLHENTSVSIYVLRLLREGKKKDQVVAILLQDGHEEYFAKQIVEEAAKLRNAKLRSQGLLLILTGGAVCLLSCLLTLGSSYSSSSFSMGLFGLTSIGIILVFIGLMKIF
jgi:hypothetical protein